MTLKNDDENETELGISENENVLERINDVGRISPERLEPLLHIMKRQKYLLSTKLHKT